MNTKKNLKVAWLFAALSIAGWTITQAQTTATWVGPSTGGEWNTAASWDIGIVPGSDANQMTNAIIGKGTNVNYNVPMTAAAFGGFTNFGVLNVNAAGYNCSNISMSLPGGQAKLFINTGGAVTLTGNFAYNSNSVVSVAAGSSLTVGGSLIIGCGSTFGTSGANANSYGFLTNNGGSITAAATSLNPGNGSVTPSCYFLINGGTNNLGAFSVAREPNPPTAGASGLVVSNGLVNMTSISIGNNSWGSMFVNGGIVTNSGTFTFHMSGTTGRPSRFYQTGGLFVTPDPNLIVFSPSGAAAAENDYSVLGGTNIVGGFSFGTSGALGLVKLTNAASIYVGSQGLAWPGQGTTTASVSLQNGGLFGATAPWVGAVPMTNNSGVLGIFTFQTADASGNPNNIQLTGAVAGSGSLKITGGGTLLLSATNTYSGSTLINGGTLALDVNGSLASSKIIVGSGTKFDVSAVNGGYVLTNQTLAGSGVVTGAVTVVSGATIYPGSNALTGTLSFSNSVTETGGVVNEFSLSGAPNPNNDLAVIAGNFNVSGTNYVYINAASLVAGSVYQLFNYYGGTFNGSLTNFVIQNAVGVLTNDTASTISFIPLTTLRGPTNTIWVGNPVNTNWDVETTTNWLNAGALDYFVPGDNVQFTDAGATNNPVNLVGTLTPGSILVNSHSNYVFASTSGGLIGGTAGLTVTNSGTLIILTTNTYSGITTIEGGATLVVSNLANSLNPSAIGESGSLVISNGNFGYTGSAVAIDLGVTFGTASSAINVSTNGSLTLNGNLGGSGGLNNVGAGTLILNGSSSYAGATTLSNGTLQVSGITALGGNMVNFDGGELLLPVPGAQQFYGNVFNVATTGTIYFSGATSFNVIGTTGGSGSLAGTGTLNIDIPNAGGYCTFNENLESFAGTIHPTADSLGFVRFNSGGNSTGAQICTGSTNATFDLGNGGAVIINRNGGGANFGNYDLGALAGDTNTFLKGCASGSSASTYSIGAKNLNTTFAGIIEDGPASGAVVAITKIGAGTLTLLGQNNYSGATIVNNGVLALSYNPTNLTDGTISPSASITIATGAVIDVSGRSDGTLSVGNNLQGSGTIRGILNASGMVSPGGGITGGIGTLTVTNTVNLGGTAWMKLNRAGSPNSDRLVSSTAGVITYGGTLVVTNIGAPLQVNDTFTLFSAGTYNNSFGTLVLPNYYTWDTSQLAVSGQVKVTGTSLPGIASVDFSGLAGGSITINATNGAPSGPVVVLTSTNVALPLGSWTPVTTNNFDGSGNLSLPITVDPTLPQSYYLLQVY